MKKSTVVLVRRMDETGFSQDKQTENAAASAFLPGYFRAICRRMDETEEKCRPALWDKGFRHFSGASSSLFYRIVCITRCGMAHRA
jgi:hypothetical protein